MANIRAEVLISGRVQGVWFRQSTKNTADNHRVRGWCRNNPDGSVEAVLEGEEAAVTALIEWCKRGPENARVDHLQVDLKPATGEFDGFKVR